MPAPSRSSSPYLVDQIAVTMHRSVFGAWWRWRTELTAFAVVAGSYFYGWYRLGSWLWPLVLLGALVLVLALVPHSRRFILARLWALFTRHRLQRSFWELGLHTRAGRLPLVPWVTGTAVGSRAWVLLRAGMTFSDFDDSAGAFATACGALDCRVTAGRWAWLVCIDIVRRDVLGPARVIRSPLGDLPAIEADPGPDPAPSWPDSALAGD